MSLQEKPTAVGVYSAIEDIDVIEGSFEVYKDQGFYKTTYKNEEIVAQVPKNSLSVREAFNQALTIENNVRKIDDDYLMSDYSTMVFEKDGMKTPMIVSEYNPNLIELEEIEMDSELENEVLDLANDVYGEILDGEVIYGENLENFTELDELKSILHYDMAAEKPVIEPGELPQDGVFKAEPSLPHESREEFLQDNGIDERVNTYLGKPLPQQEEEEDRASSTTDRIKSYIFS